MLVVGDIGGGSVRILIYGYELRYILFEGVLCRRLVWDMVWDGIGRWGCAVWLHFGFGWLLYLLLRLCHGVSCLVGLSSGGRRGYACTRPS